MITGTRLGLCGLAAAAVLAAGCSRGPQKVRPVGGREAPAQRQESAPLIEPVPATTARKETGTPKEPGDRKTAETAAGIPAAGLLAWYPFNGNANDESGNGHHGEVRGARLTKDRFGKENSAYAFDGNEVISVNDPPGIEEGLAISLWVSYGIADTPYDFGNVMIAWGGVKGYYCIDTHRPDGGPDAGHMLFVWDHQWKRKYEHGWQASGGFCLGKTRILPGAWYHVVGVHDGRELRLHIDGRLHDSTPGVMGTPTKPIHIGRGADKERWYFHGNIDDVRIYGRALAEREILDLFKEGGFTKPVQPLPDEGEGRGKAEAF